jgi:hypothetical protein
MSQSEKRRAYGREYAYRKRQERIAALNMNTLTCQAMLSRGHPCRTRLQSRFVDGHTVPFCPTCDRKARGLCIECEAPVEGTVRKALYCALHKKLALIASLDRYKKRNAAKLRKKERKRMADPVVHADRLAYKRDYRKALPGKVATYKKRHYQRNREKVLAYMAEYRAKRREHYRAMELARHHGTLPPRTCLTCPTVLTGRPKRCDACKEGDRKAARQRIAARPAFQETAA